MENVKDKLGYLSFAEKSWEVLDNSLHILRDVKLRFCKCCQNCFDQEEVSLPEWHSKRSSCLLPCQSFHNSIFDVFTSKFSASRDVSLKCVYSCQSEYATSKFGEEDQTICEEKCYETFWKSQKQINEELRVEYEKVFFKKFNKY
jgi:hypothetical protein